MTGMEERAIEDGSRNGRERKREGTPEDFRKKIIGEGKVNERENSKRTGNTISMLKIG